MAITGLAVRGPRSLLRQIREALAGVAANLVGFSEGLTAQTARAASSSVFLIAIPLALVGTWAAFRLTGSAASSA